SALKAAFRGRPGDHPVIQAARLQKIEREMATNVAFLEQRERFAKQYVESDTGQRRVRELIEQTVAKRASELQAEVDKRESQLAAKRDELDRQLGEAVQDHRAQVASLEREREEIRQQVGALETAVGQLREQLALDAKVLAAKLQEQLPLLAALTSARADP